MEYLEFFNLNDDPFRLTPDPRFFYPSEQHKIGMMSLEYAILNNEGFCLITGEPGTGKTLLLRKLLSEIEDKVETALIMSPKLTPLELLKAIADDLNLVPRGNSKHDYIKLLYSHLISCYEKNKKVILIIDEAQQVPDETLEEIRLLSNLETNTEKLIHIIMAGQTELYERLSSKNHRQLMQRISVKASLPPLSLDQVKEYVKARLRKAGSEKEIFAEGAYKALYKYSHGIPRVVNLLCSRALMAAYVEGKPLVEKDHIKIAATDLKIAHEEKTSKGLKYLFWLIPLMLMVGTGAIYIVGNKVWKKPQPELWQYQKGEKHNASEQMQEKHMVINRQYVPLRAEPSLWAMEIDWAKKGTTFKIIDKLTIDGIAWYKVEGEDGLSYWLTEEDLG